MINVCILKTIQNNKKTIAVDLIQFTHRFDLRFERILKKMSFEMKINRNIFLKQIDGGFNWDQICLSKLFNECIYGEI